VGAGRSDAGAGGAAPRAPAAPEAPGPGSSRAWRRSALPALVLACACVTLTDLFDADVFKRHVVVLPLAAAAALALALGSGDGLRRWLASPGAWLVLLTFALGLPRAGALLDADVHDRLVTLVLATAAAALGAGGGAWGRALVLAGLATGAVTLLQGLGVEAVLAATIGARWAEDPGPYTVGLAGNTTRAGGLLALAVVGAAAWTSGLPRGARDAASTGSRGGGPGTAWALAARAALVVATAGLVLTQARAAWAAAALGLLWLLVAQRRAGARAASGPSPRGSLLLVAGGVVLAVLVAGPDVLAARKIPGATAPLSPSDPTTRVRLALWTSTARLVAHEPLGVGLGRYRRAFGPWRDPEEAATVGLGGAPTEASHPHNEALLAAAEGGWPAGLAWVAFAGLTLWRGRRRAAGPVFVAGVVLAMAQDAWTSPTTLAPCFAAAGALWAGPRRAPSRGLVPAAMVLAIAVALPSVARLDAHLSLRRFVQQAARHGVNPATFEALVEASRAAPTDVQVQRVTAHWGGRLLAALPGHDVVRETTEQAVARLAALAPPPPAAPDRR